MIKKQNLTGHFFALCCTFIWGISFISSKILLEILTPGEILFFRFTVGFIILFILSPKVFPFTNWKTELLCFSAAFCGMLLYQYLENAALIYSSASNVGLLVATAPFFTGIISPLFGGEKMRLPFFLGFLLSILGVFFVVFNGKFILALNPFGDFLAVSAAFVWAFYTLLTNRLNQKNLNIVQITRRMFLYAMIMSAPFVVNSAFPGKLLALCQMRYLLNILFLGVLASGLCFVFWNTAMKRIGALNSSVYIYTIPVITLFFSFLILGEPITPLALLGTAFILAGLFVSERRKL